MAMMVNRDAPMSGLANLMALKGRMGDTELVHMSPPEIRGLASLGQLTINPSTGLPEAFNLKQILPAVAGIAATAFLPGSGLAGGLFSGIGGTALAGALGTFGGSLLAGNKLDQALTQGVLSGLTGYAMGNIFAGADPTAGKGPLGVVPQGGDWGLGSMDDIASGFDAAGITTPPAGLSTPATSLADKMQIDKFYAEPNSILMEKTTTFDPSKVNKFLGAEPVTLEAGKLYTPSEISQATGGRYGYLSPTEALQKPGTYAPALGSLAAMAMEPEPYQAPEKKPTEITPQEMYVAEEGAGAPSPRTALEQALYGGAERQLPTYGYRNLPSYTVAKSGGLIGLAEGGMPLVKLISKFIKNKKELPRDFDSDVRNLPTDLEEISPKDRKEAEDYAASVEKYRKRLALAGYSNAEFEPPNPKVSEKPPAYYRDYESLPLDRWYGPKDELRQMSLEDLIKSKEDINFRTQYGSDLIDRVLKEKQYEYGEDPDITGFSEGGIVGLARGGMPEQGKYFEGRVEGNGDGMSDEVEFEVEGEDPDMAMLSRDEYVLPADVVAILGNGSSEAGADKLDMFVKQTRKKAFGTEKQQKEMKGDGGLSCLVA